MKIIGVLLAGLMLVGCATTKPVMPNDMYGAIAGIHVDIERCSNLGWLPLDLKTSGKQFISNQLGQYNFDSTKLDTEANWINNLRSKPDQNYCNKLAGDIQGYNQRTKVQDNSPQQSDYRDVQQMINDMRVRSTTCNTVGKRTTCSTY